MISVVIPAYCCADSISDVLTALRGQSLQPSEIIVVDDCSPDGLQAALKPFAREVMCLRNPVNSGLSKTYNHGLRSATGEYVLTLHSDCVLEPNYLAIVYETLSTHPDVAAVTGQYVFSDFHAMTIADQLFCVLNILPVRQALSENMDELAFIEGKADLFRRTELEQLGFFDENLVLTAEDQDLSAKFRRLGYHFLQDNRARFSSKYNGTQDSLWKVLRKQFSYAQGQMYVLAKYRGDAIKATTTNRNARACHRMSQVFVACAIASLLAASLVWPRALVAVGSLVVIRAGYYLWLAAPMRFPARLLAVPMGLAADVLYALGLIRGLLLFAMHGRA